MPEQEIKYPVNFDLRVFMDRSNEDQTNQMIIEKILTSLNINHSKWDQKYSRQSNYIRFSVNVTINDAETMQLLYLKMSQEPHIKTAI